jgi:hypothetical protein
VKYHTHFASAVRRAPLLLPVMAEQANPTDAQTVYWGGTSRIPLTTTGGVGRIYFPRAGRVTRVSVSWYATSAAGTSENISLYFRLNDTTDTLVATIGSTAAAKHFELDPASITVAKNDFFEMKVVYPTWVTNPTGVVYCGYAILE